MRCGSRTAVGWRVQSDPCPARLLGGRLEDLNMEALFVNHDDMLSTEVDFIRLDRWRVTFRDLDADRVIETRFFVTREAAVAYAERLAQQVAA